MVDRELDWWSDVLEEHLDIKSGRNDWFMTRGASTFNLVLILESAETAAIFLSPIKI